MPEGHTVHRLANAFRENFAGQTLRASSPQGRFTEGAAVLDGLRLTHAEAHGKQMFLGFAADAVWLRVHLGLYGMWRFAGPGLAGIGRRTPRVAEPADPDDPIPAPRGAVRLRLIAGARVADLSGPTSCTIETPEQMAAAQAKLGEDPLRQDANPDRAYERIHASRSALGLLLMRQDLMAGIGNIYRAEVLFRARLNPFSPGTALSPTAWRALWDDLTMLMRQGVRTGRIVTVDMAGGRGRGGRVYVAHRAGEPCRICGTLVQAEAMAGRTLYFCPTCQGVDLPAGVSSLRAVSAI